jgi:CBS domain-containing protein
MKVRDAMTRSPATCTPTMTIAEAARLMANADCGSLPVLGEDDEFPIGMITDRDIAVRAVAAGRGPETLVGECMSTTAHTITEDARLDDCIELLELRQIRRAIVVDHTGRCVGVIAQADIASHASKRKSGELLRSVSQPSEAPTLSKSAAW